MAQATPMLSAGLGPIAFLIVVNLLLLIGGQFMQPSGLLICCPTGVSDRHDAGHRSDSGSGGYSSPFELALSSTPLAARTASETDFPA